MGFSVDAPSPKVGEGRTWPDGFVAGLAAYLLTGAGYHAGQDGPDKLAAVRDDGGIMVGNGTDADDCRKAVIAQLVNDGHMVVPAGLMQTGAVFQKADGVPDHFVGLTVRSTTDYSDNPDAGPGKYGLWVGTPDKRAGRKRAPKNGNGAPTPTPNAG